MITWGSQVVGQTSVLLEPQSSDSAMGRKTKATIHQSGDGMMKRRVLHKWMVILGSAAFLYGVGSLFQPTVVVGQSMAPTLDPGKVIYLDRTYYLAHTPSRGEVVVFKRGDETYVKRVYRGPGETYHYLSGGGQLLGLVNDEDAAAMKQRWLHRRTSVTVKMGVVPMDSVYVVGDNAPNSEDSRVFGPVPLDKLIGRAHLDVDEGLSRSAEFSPGYRKPAPPTEKRVMAGA